MSLSQPVLSKTTAEYGILILQNLLMELILYCMIKDTSEVYLKVYLAITETQALLSLYFGYQWLPASVIRGENLQQNNNIEKNLG